jgi:hypothetical protein
MRVIIIEIYDEDIKNLRKSFYHPPTLPKVVKPRAKRRSKVKYLVKDGKEVKSEPKSCCRKTSCNTQKNQTS